MITKNNQPIHIEENAASIRKILIATLIMEQGCRELVGRTKYDLKNMINNAITASNILQDWFKNHPKVSRQYAAVFKTEFQKSEIELYAEILQTVYGLSEQDLETIINALKSQINVNLSS